MFCVRSRYAAGTSTVQPNRAVALPASAQHISQAQRIFNRDHGPLPPALASVRVGNPLTDFALVDVLSGHCGRRLPLVDARGNRRWLQMYGRT